MWVPLCAVADVPDDDVVEVIRDDHVYCAYRIAGTHHVTDGICTHAVARLAEGFVMDDFIECPLHNGRFRIATGEAIDPPACDPLAIYAVRVEGDVLLIELPG